MGNRRRLFGKSCPLFSALDFHNLVSGRRRGPWAWLLRSLLRLGEIPYAVAVRWRNGRFDAGSRPSTRVDACVISVGNLTVGGTGKTPFVEWLARWFRARGLRVTLISRGYKAEQGARNDEALELEQRLRDVPHLQHPDRVLAARMAIEEFECQVILLDDAFQHRRIARDLDIVLIDALQPFGHGHLLPRGLLREPVASLKRAQVVVLSRADLVDEPTRRSIQAQVAPHAASATWVEVAHTPRCLTSSSGREQGLDSLRGMRVGAFCGIGNPEGFRRSLARCGIELASWREFPDHHAYTRDDVRGITTWAREQNLATLICTHKDLVKIASDRLEGLPLWGLSISLEILAGGAELESRLLAVCPRADSV